MTERVKQEYKDRCAKTLARNLAKLELLKAAFLKNSGSLGDLNHYANSMNELLLGAEYLKNEEETETFARIEHKVDVILASK